MLGGLVVELDNLIVQSLKGYVITTMWQLQMGGPRTPGAQRFGSSDYELAVETAKILAATKPGKKPKTPKIPQNPSTIRSPLEIQSVLRFLTGGVPTEFSNAVALNHTVFGELKYFRHFYAHRCEDTLSKAVASAPVFATGAFGHPDDFIEAVHPPAGVPKYLDWWGQLVEFYEVAT